MVGWTRTDGWPSACWAHPLPRLTREDGSENGSFTLSHHLERVLLPFLTMTPRMQPGSTRQVALPLSGIDGGTGPRPRMLGLWHATQSQTIVVGCWLGKIVTAVSLPMSRPQVFYASLAVCSSVRSSASVIVTVACYVASQSKEK